jgi:hypothetical protein
MTERRSWRWRGLIGLVAVLAVACGGGGKKTARTCDTDDECEGGVCYQNACYQACQGQDDCADDEFCVRKADASSSLCLTAATYAGCESAADCADLVVSACQQSTCQGAPQGCAITAAADGATCPLAEGAVGSCSGGACVATTLPDDVDGDTGGETLPPVEPAVEVVDAPHETVDVVSDSGSPEPAPTDVVAPEPEAEPMPEPSPDVIEVAPSDTPEIDASTGPLYLDLATGLVWVRADAPSAQDQAGAVAWCDALVLEGYEDWRLPTISELRTTIAGCPGTVAGGACQVADPGCLSSSCWSSSACACPLAGGPGEGGFYWEPGVWELVGGTLHFWSSSIVATDTGNAWALFPRNGSVDEYDKGDWGLVRCVRSAN